MNAKASGRNERVLWMIESTGGLDETAIYIAAMKSPSSPSTRNHRFSCREATILLRNPLCSSLLAGGLRVYAIYDWLCIQIRRTAGSNGRFLVVFFAYYHISVRWEALRVECSGQSRWPHELVLDPWIAITTKTATKLEKNLRQNDELHTLKSKNCEYHHEKLQIPTFLAHS